MSEAITVDELTFELRRSGRRKTLELTLDRGGELIITTPPDVSDAVIAAFVREKKFWLYTKIAEKEARQQPTRGKDFVTGEGFAYLGRSYRLLVVDAQDEPLRLDKGRFVLARASVATGRECFVSWYAEHAGPWLARRVAPWAERMGATPKAIEVRDLGFRWGSCGQAGGVNFHWATIMLPASVIDYVIVHELAHLWEPNHSSEFWQRIARALPEYEQRKAWLAEHGGQYVLL